MTMPIFLLDSSFGEVQDRSKDHLDQMSRTCILNLFHMFKVSLFYPSWIRDVSHTPTDAYILERLGVHFTHTFLQAFSSLTDGAAIRASLGNAVRASWCSVLMEHFWWEVLGLCDTLGWLTLWRICWLQHPVDRRNATMIYLCFWLVFHRYISMFYLHLTFL